VINTELLLIIVIVIVVPILWYKIVLLVIAGKIVMIMVYSQLKALLKVVTYGTIGLTSIP